MTSAQPLPHAELIARLTLEEKAASRPRFASMTVRIYDAVENLLAETDISVDWGRNGGSEKCGGPSLADVTVRL